MTYFFSVSSEFILLEPKFGCLRISKLKLLAYHSLAHKMVDLNQFEKDQYMPVHSEDDSLGSKQSISDDQFRKWKIKRKKTVIIFFFINFVSALNFTVILPSLWFYLKKVHSPAPSVFYGVTFGLAEAIALPFMLFIGWLVDKTRRIKLTIMCIISIVMLGNAIFSIGYSQYLLLIGRVLADLSVTLYSVVFSETARCYEPSELQRVITVFTIGNSLGKVLGPSLNIFLHHIDIKIGAWHISYLNAGSLLMLILFVVMLVLVLLFVSDLSKEFDFKESLSRGKMMQKEQETSKEHDEKGREKHQAVKDSQAMIDQPGSALQIIFRLFKSSTISVILFTTFYSSFSWGFFEAMVSLIASVILHWNTSDVSKALIGMAIVYIVSSLLIWKIAKQVTEFSLILTGIALNIIGYLCLCVIGKRAHEYKIAFVFYVIVVIIAVASLLVEKIPMPCIMGKLIPSEHQSLSEAVRFSIGRIGLSLSQVIAGVSVQSLLVVGLFFAVICTINGILSLKKHKPLSRPEPVNLSK